MNDSCIQSLRDNVRGAVLCPGDAGYDAARGLHNGMIDKRPAAIVRCTGVADVRRCVNTARETTCRRPCAAAVTGWRAMPVVTAV